MRLYPRKQHSDAGYPDRAEHQMHRRTFLQTLGGAVLGAGLCAAAGQARADNTKKDDPKGALKKRVATLVGNLGHDDFRIRRKATAELIQIGKGSGKDKQADKEARDLVMKAVAGSCAAKDPEVAQRCKQVIAALTPKIKVPPPRPPMKGIVRLRGL